MVWPVRTTAGGPEHVPGIAMLRRATDDALQLLEVLLVPASLDGDESDDLPRRPAARVALAEQWGLISSEERAAAEQRTAARARDEAKDWLDGVQALLTPGQAARLRGLLDRPAEFAKMLLSMTGMRMTVPEALQPWPTATVAESIAMGLPDAAISWHAEQMKSRLSELLDASVNAAWRAAFEEHRHEERPRHQRRRDTHHGA